MIIRPATPQDIPSLAQRWYDEKAKTCFNHLDVEWTIGGCAGFLMEILYLPTHCLFVAERDKQIIAACGAVLQHNLLPPHPLVIGEWMWWGQDKRAVVAVLHAAHAWGKHHGATLARYTLNQPSHSGTKFTETYRWEVL